MSLQLLSVVVLVAAFVLTTFRPLNLGAVLFAACFLVGGLVAGLPPAELLSGFPAELFVILVGITYLFNVADRNGTVTWLVSGAVRLVRGNITLIPWIMFAITGVLSAIGAVYAVPVIAPIALSLAARNRIPQLLMSLMVMHGWGAGALSPISVYGVIVRGVMEQSGIPAEPVTIFVISLVTNVAIGLLVFVAFRFGRLRRTVSDPATAPDDADGGTRPTTAVETAPGPTSAKVITMGALVLLVVGTLTGYDVGLLAITLAVLVGLTDSAPHQQAVAAVPWSIVLLVCGTLTYVGVLQTIGTVDWIGDGVVAIGSPLFASLLLAYVGAVVSAFASSSGIISALVPLSIPLIEASGLNPVLVVAVVAVGSTVVDVSPFSTNGAIVVANASEGYRERMLRQLTAYGGGLVLVAPPLLWLALMVPSAA